jgi:hypothetical protein
MPYFVHCHKCSHGDFGSDVLNDSVRCPHCGSVPARYTYDGIEYCWLHRVPISSRYTVAANFLFVEYVWRGHEYLFPNAKLYEADESEESHATTSFCLKCQEAYEQWLDGYW